MLNFDSLEKGLRIVSFYHILCMIFQEKYFSYYIPLTTKFHCLIPLLFEILDNMCIATVCLPGCDVTNFENT